MKTPKRIEPLVEDGLVDVVLRQLMSGKEATVYVVQCGDEIRCAKVYKEANQRGFHQAVHYTEGRKVKNSRQARAMEKGSRYGRKEQESAWQHAEVDALYKLASAGVRVPHPFGFYEGVLLMELVTDENGAAAPRLNDLELTADQARDFHARLIRQVVLMLCAGIVHGDLSEFNIRARACHHRLAAGGGCRRQQQCQPHAGARRRQPGQLLCSVRPGTQSHPVRQRDMGDLPARRTLARHTVNRSR
jgi:RIO kinase 1